MVFASRRSIGLGVLVALLSAIVGWKFDIFHVYEFGGDEGYEVYKAFLITKGYLLYRDIWNDQPPIHTYLLAGLFRLFGPSIGVARCVSIFSAGGTALCLWMISRRTVGRCAATFVVLGFLAWPEVLMLSGSAMLEIPMLFLTTASLWLLDRSGSQQRFRIFAAASVFAIAVNVKFTALLFAPYLLFELRPTSQFKPRLGEGFSIRTDLSEWFLRCAFFGVFFLGACAVISVCCFEREAWDAIFKSHFAPVFPEFRIQAERYRFSWDLFAPVCEVVAIACVGVVYGGGERRAASFSAVLALVALIAVHSTHQPFWQYYTIHFSIPTCLIAGVGVDWAVHWMFANCCQGLSRLTAIRAIGLLVGLLWVSGITAFNVVELIREVSSRPLVSTVALVKKLRSESVPGEVVFSDQPIVCFYAGSLMPPAIAVLPAKRFWSKQISVQEILSVLHKIDPKRIAVFGPDLREALRKNPPLGMQRDQSEINIDYWIRGESNVRN